MSDDMAQNQNEQTQEGNLADLPKVQPDLTGTPDSVADDLDNDTGTTANSEVDEAGSKGGGKQVNLDNTGEYAGNLSNDEVGSIDTAENMDYDQPRDNTGYDEWGYYSTEDEPVDY